MKLLQAINEAGELDFEFDLNDENDQEKDEFKLDLNDEKPDSFSNSESDEGILRTVPKASMIYKREQQDGTFEEMWIYNTTKDNRRDQQIYNNIVSGSDIPQGGSQSEDKTQGVETWAIGNVKMVLLTGLTN